MPYIYFGQQSLFCFGHISDQNKGKENLSYFIFLSCARGLPLRGKNFLNSLAQVFILFLNPHFFIKNLFNKFLSLKKHSFYFNHEITNQRAREVYLYGGEKLFSVLSGCLKISGHRGTTSTGERGSQKVAPVPFYFENKLTGTEGTTSTGDEVKKSFPLCLILKNIGQQRSTSTGEEVF